MTYDDKPVLVAVLGVTGAGKTSFINRAADSKLVVGNDVHSCTQDIGIADFELDGKRIRLIDTPGFDDTERQDADILEDIAKWLSTTYQAGMLLTGIILLQPISNNKVFGSEARRTRLFKKICGKDAFSHIVIATTMWSELTDAASGDQRVKERCDGEAFWGELINGGARHRKHEDNTSSAHDIIRMLMNKDTQPLLMQQELEKSQGMLYETSASQQLYNDLGASGTRELERLEELRKELRLATEDREALQADLRLLRAKVENIERQKELLETTQFDDLMSLSDEDEDWLSRFGSRFGTYIGGASLATATGAGLVASALLCSVM